MPLFIKIHIIITAANPQESEAVCKLFSIPPAKVSLHYQDYFDHLERELPDAAHRIPLLRPYGLIGSESPTGCAINYTARILNRTHDQSVKGTLSIHAGTYPVVDEQGKPVEVQGLITSPAAPALPEVFYDFDEPFAIFFALYQNEAKKEDLQLVLHVLNFHFNESIEDWINPQNIGIMSDVGILNVLNTVQEQATPTMRALQRSLQFILAPSTETHQALWDESIKQVYSAPVMHPTSNNEEKNARAVVKWFRETYSFIASSPGGESTIQMLSQDIHPNYGLSFSDALKVLNLSPKDALESLRIEQIVSLQQGFRALSVLSELPPRTALDAEQELAIKSLIDAVNMLGCSQIGFLSENPVCERLCKAFSAYRNGMGTAEQFLTKLYEQYKKS
jgi:hypothetical protein